MWKMKVVAEIVAVLVIGTLTYATAAKASTVTDPRKCGIATRSERCAREAATLVARRILAKRFASPVRLYQGPVSCQPRGTLLRWKCSYPGGYVSVTYKATHTGWHVYTSVIATP